MKKQNITLEGESTPFTPESAAQTIPTAEQSEQTKLQEDLKDNSTSAQASSDESESESDFSEDAEDTVSFADLGLDEYTLKAIEKKGFVTPSPIQVLAIPRLLNGDTNLIARARTGTGKTAAFGLPIIQAIREKSDHVEALILEPTRELAVQTCTEMQSFATDGIPRTCVLYGGANYSTQIKDLKRGSEIVVGTPGRIKDHLERKTLNLSKIKYFILDEGDEMLDMGFIDDIREIFEQANPESRILLFSATMPAPILKIAADFMGEYDIIEEKAVVDEALLIDQKYWVVRESEKIEALVRLIDMSPDFYGLVFTQTKMDADNVTRMLDLRGYEAAALHGDIMQNQREKVLERFRSKKTRILVATDVAARGIDISGLTHVVNYSLPFDAATYVHRIGRTGRAGKEGMAVTFVRPEERRKLTFMQRSVAKASKGEMTEGKIPGIHEVLEIKQKRIIQELKQKIFTTTEGESLPLASADQSSFATPSPKGDAPLKSPEEEADTEAAVTEEISAATESLTQTPQMFTDFASELCQNQDAQQVLAAVLSAVYGDQLSPKHYGKVSAQKDFTPSGDQLRIFVSLGKKDGYRAREIADYFSNLLHIPGRMVDQIDVAQQFSLVSLPVASAKKAIEMSKSNHKLPHMHLDSKEEGRGSRKGSSGNRSDRPQERKSDRFEKGSRREKSDSKFTEGRKKGSRPNVHAQSQRTSSRSSGKNGGAAAFIKSGKKVERF